MKKTSINNKIILIISAIIITIVSVLFVIMTIMMINFADRMAFNIIEPVVKNTELQISNKFNSIGNSFISINDNPAFSPAASLCLQSEYIYSRKNELELKWLGIYNREGLLMNGTEGSPASLSYRRIITELRGTTSGFVIDNTKYNNGNLEIIVGTHVQIPWAFSFIIGSKCYQSLVGEYLESVAITDTNVVILINDNGYVMGHNKDVSLVKNSLHITNIFTRDVSIAMFNNVLNRQVGSGIIILNHEKYISYMPIEHSNWKIIILAVRSDFTGDITQTLILGIIYSILVFLISIVIVRVVLGKLLSEPLKNITKAAEAMAIGEFADANLKFPLHKTDEVGKLYKGFSAVSSSLNRAINDIANLTSQASLGKLENRVEPNKHHGDFNVIMRGINEVLDAFCGHIDAMPDAFALLNEDIELIFSNTSMKNLLVNTKQNEKTEHYLAKIISNGQSTHLPLRVLDLFQFKIHHNELFTADVSIKQLSGVINYYNITLKRIAAKIQLHDAKPRTCVMLLLSDITEQTHAVLEAEASNRSKSLFLSNMSHEMRTPLNAIIGMTSIAKGSNDREKKDYCLLKIENASKHLLGVINDVLDISEIESGKFSLVNNNFNIKEMIDLVYDVVMFKLDEKQQKFSLNIPDSLPIAVHGDAQKLSQVLTNILFNAIKFTPVQGEISLNVEYNYLHDNKVNLVFSVIDNGIGISKDHQQKLFDSFYQVDKALNKQFKGTGLGLTISNNIIKAMGGMITIDSELGAGSTFTFNVVLSEINDYSVENDIYNLQERHINLTGINIILADDIEINREIFLGMLEDSGANILVAENGQVAYELYVENHEIVDIIFMDINMPIMDGVEATTMIRNTVFSNAKSIPIVAITADVVTDNINMYLNSGLNDHIGKPINFKELIKVLRKYINKKGEL